MADIDSLTLVELVALDPAPLDIDELGLLKRSIKERAQAAIRAANAIQDEKIAELHLAEAHKQIAAAAAREGVPEDVIAQRWLTEQYADVGRNVQARLYLGLPRLRDEVNAAADAAAASLDEEQTP